MDGHWLHSMVLEAFYCQKDQTSTDPEKTKYDEGNIMVPSRRIDHEA